MKVSNRQLPPGLGRYLAFNPEDIKENPLGFYRRMWQEYGDLVRLPILPNYCMYLVAHPNYIEHILSTHQERYSKPDLFKKPMNMMAGESILTSEGDFWLKHRRLMQPAFHMKHLANLAIAMVSCTESLVQEWDKKSDGEIIDIASETLRLTLKIAGLTLFSTDISDDSSSLGKAFRTGFEFVNYKMNNLVTPPLWFPTLRNLDFRQSKQTLDNLVQEIIDSRRQNSVDSPDLLSMLMAARDEETGEGMSDEQLKNEAITLLIAGHETVASALSWTWYLLGQNPEIAANMQDELGKVLNGSNPTFDKLPQLDYTRRVFEETLRLYPPAWALPRVSLEDDEMEGYFIPKGTIVTLAKFITHRHPEFWENPDEFNPDNFLSEKVNQRPKFAYFPFGGGQRICIGKSFALMEATIIMAIVSQHFKLELVNNHPVEIDPRFTLRPKYGIKVKLWKRS
ncbi:cytochrome P450 [Brunnivagina elsteri]|uniref:Cytochrome P450 n=1 Tax=Brunnivagina elsteri CCALA 953 TaxID=987040 RepID=A0A2A2TGK0_9CYAN|nr:cytochrome P450 [Calothrix elsteri]PAX52870.1 cytochrome P450 [Calothrix elsteri CCALA 953]